MHQAFFIADLLCPSALTAGEEGVQISALLLFSLSFMHSDS